MGPAAQPRTCSELLLCCGWFVLASCRSPGSSAAADAGAAPAAVVRSAAVSPGPSVPAAAPPPAASAAADVAPAGQARLILERVDTKSDCGGGFIGFDVLLETKTGDEPPHREHVFCPDGPHGPQPSLNMFGMCRAFPRCQLAPADAAGSVELSCGKEHVRLSSSGQRTTLSGSFGEREVAAVFMTLAVQKRWRAALVDC